MRVFKLMLLFVSISLVFSQTTISYNSALYDVGVEFTRRTVNDASFDPGPSGEGNFDFTPFTTGNENTFASVVYSASIPHIGDCSVTPNYILYHEGISDTLYIEGWGFFNVETAHTEGLGLYGSSEDTSSGTVSELWGFNTSYTPSTYFPINYEDTWTEITESEWTAAQGFLSLDFVNNDTIYNTVDGYGQVILPSGTFQALRVKKLHATRSVCDNFLYPWDTMKRYFSYDWVTNEAGFVVTFEGPKDSTGGVPDSTFTTGKLVIQISNSALGIKEKQVPASFELKAYPNPFNSSCKIEVHTGTKIEIIDINGRIISASNKTPIIWQPDESISSGVYLVRATAGNETITKRIIYLR